MYVSFSSCHRGNVTSDYSASIREGRRVARVGWPGVGSASTVIPVLTPATCPADWADELARGRTPEVLLRDSPLRGFESREPWRCDVHDNDAGSSEPVYAIDTMKAFEWLFFLWQDLVPMPLEVLPAELAAMSPDQLEELARSVHVEQQRWYEEKKKEPVPKYSMGHHYPGWMARRALNLPLGRQPVTLREVDDFVAPDGVVTADIRTIAFLMRHRERLLSAAPTS